MVYGVVLDMKDFLVNKIGVNLISIWCCFRYKRFFGK